MLALHYLENLNNVVYPPKPSSYNIADWGVAFEKCVENRGTREMKTDRYIASNRKYEELKEKDVFMEAIPEDGDRPAKHTLSEDYVFYMNYLNSDVAKVDDLLQLELYDTVAEFFELESEILEEEGIWVYAVVDGLVKSALKGNVNETLKHQVEELNIGEMVADLIGEGFRTVKSTLANRDFAFDFNANQPTSVIEPLAV